MTPAATIEHQLPGRMRLRIPSRRGEPFFFEGLVRELSTLPSIREVRTNPLTGNVLLHYSGPIEPIIAAAADFELFEIGQPEPRARAAESVRPAGAGKAPGLTNGIAAGLTGLSLFQVTRGQAFGSASENLWHAFGARRLLGRPDLAVGFGAIAVYQVLSGNLFGSASSLLFYALMIRQIGAMSKAPVRKPATAAEPMNSANVVNAAKPDKSADFATPAEPVGQS